MPKYEITVALEKEDNPKPSKKEGDIVTVKRHPAIWGKKILDGWLIVIVETEATFETMLWLSHQRVYTDKKNGNKVVSFKEMDEETAPKGTIIDKATGTRLILPNERAKDFECIYKNRFAIKFSHLKKELNINLKKVRDKKIKYQPFKKASQLAAPFDGLNGRYSIHKTEIETQVGSDANTIEEETVINLDSKAILWDKLKNKYTTPIESEVEAQDG